MDYARTPHAIVRSHSNMHTIQTTYGVLIVSDAMAGTKEMIAIAVKKNLFILRRAPLKR